MISRRRFLWVSAASVAGMLCGSSLLAAENNPIAGECFLIGDGVPGDASLFGLTTYSSRPGRVKIWRFGQDEVLEIKLPFLPHSFVAHPRAPHRVITFEKWGRHLAEIDLASMAMVRVTQAQSGRRFFGHGAHSGDSIYATQMDDDRGRGIVSVLDAANHKVMEEFETLGAFPHDCQWLPDSDTLLIVNSRRSGTQNRLSENFSSLIWMDAKTGKCLNQLFIKTQAFGYAHLAQSAEGFMVLSGSYLAPHGRAQPLLSVIRPDGVVQALNLASNSQAPLQGEALSLYLNEDDDQVTVTFPKSSRIQVWNYRTAEFIQQIKIGEPRGLAYSMERRALIASSAQTKDFLIVDKRLKLTSATPAASNLGGNGSHLYRLAI